MKGAAVPVAANTTIYIIVVVVVGVGVIPR